MFPHTFRSRSSVRGVGKTETSKDHTKRPTEWTNRNLKSLRETKIEGRMGVKVGGEMGWGWSLYTGPTRFSTGVLSVSRVFPRFCMHVQKRIKQENYL